MDALDTPCYRGILGALVDPAAAPRGSSAIRAWHPPADKIAPTLRRPGPRFDWQRLARAGLAVWPRDAQGGAPSIPTGSGPMPGPFAFPMWRRIFLLNEHPPALSPPRRARPARWPRLRDHGPSMAGAVRGLNRRRAQAVS